MEFKRCSGILMPISSLPGGYGIGSMGKPAHDFVDFLAKAGQTIWQILPVGPTGYADSPYQSCSAFAGNPYFIDLDMLAADGLLTKKDYAAINWGGDAAHVDYGTLYEKRFAVLRKAYANFLKKRPVPGYETPYPDDWYRFQFLSSDWLPDYCLYMAIKEANGMVDWQQWPRALRVREPEALAEFKAEHAGEIHHKLLQALDMGGTCVQVDVQAVGLVVDDIGVCAQRIEHALGNVPAGTVGAVQTHLDALEGVDAQADQVTHVAVAARHIVHGAADMLPVGKGQLRPVLIENMELAVDVVLHQQQGLLGHLFAVAVDELDAVVVERVMAGGDHNSAVKIIHAGNIGHAGGGGDVEQVGICAGSGQACHQAVLEHIAGAAGILANDDAGRLVVAAALPQCIIIPAQKTAYLVGVVGGQIHTGLATEAVGAKIFSHNPLLLLLQRYVFSYP